MEEKILQELKEIKEMLRTIMSNTEQKDIIQNEILETASKLVSISNKITRL